MTDTERKEKLQRLTTLIQQIADLVDEFKEDKGIYLAGSFGGYDKHIAISDEKHFNSLRDMLGAEEFSKMCGGKAYSRDFIYNGVDFYYCIPDDEEQE